MNFSIVLILGLLPKGTHDWNKFLKPEVIFFLNSLRMKLNMNIFSILKNNFSLLLIEYFKEIEKMCDNCGLGTRLVNGMTYIPGIK